MLPAGSITRLPRTLRFTQRYNSNAVSTASISRIACISGLLPSSSRKEEISFSKLT